MEYIYFNFDGISSQKYNIIIQNKGEDLNFPAQPGFENEIVSPMYQNTSYLSGVSKKDRVFNFNCWANSLTTETVRSMLNWLSIDKISYLILDYNPNFKYKVKLQTMSDLKHLAYNEDGTSNYEFQIAFTTIEEVAAISNQEYSLSTEDYLSENPSGLNIDNGCPIAFRDPYDIDPIIGYPKFKILNYYSEPITPTFELGTSMGFSVSLNGEQKYSYQVATEPIAIPQDFTIDSRNGFVTVGDNLAETYSNITLLQNKGQLNIPSGNSQILTTPIQNFVMIEGLPPLLTILDSEDLIYYENTDDLFIIVQDGSYGNESTQSYDPIDKQNYIYNKINKDGTNSNIDTLTFNTSNYSEAINTGQIAWSPLDGTFNMALYNNVMLQVGQELIFYVTAQENILAGEPIMFSGFNPLTNEIFVKGSRPSELLISGYFYVGVATKNINQGEVGYATLFGIVSNLNFYNLASNPLEITNWQPGVVLYIDPENNGKLTAVPPQAPQLKIIVGAVMIPDTYGAGIGQMIISTTQGTKVSSLYDVVANDVSNGDTLVYRDGIWNAEASFNSAGSIIVQDDSEVFEAENVEDALLELYNNKVSIDPNYTMVLNSEVDKLATVSANANQNVNPDWNATEGDALILNKPNIPSEYELPIASNEVLGGVKIDNNTIVINEFGTISSVSGSGSVAEVTVSFPLNVTNGTTIPNISINEATSSTSGIMSVEDKNKLNNIEEYAQVNINADWNATTGDALILNKPNIPTQYTNEIAQDAIGSILTNSSSINLIYDDNLNTITASANFGTTSGTIVEGNDSRLSDSRIPLNHSHGNINSAGQIGAIGNLIVTTGTDGTLSTAARSGIDSRATFPPDSHTHLTSEITGLNAILSAKAKVATNEGSATNGQLLQANGNQTFTYTTVNASNLSIQDQNDNYDSSYVEGALEEAAIKDRYLENLFLLDHSTGVYEFEGLTKVDDTHFSIGAMKGYIVDNTTDPDNPTIKHIQYAGAASVEDIYIGTSYQTQIFIDSNGQIDLSTSDQPSCIERRNAIFLGRSVHPVPGSIITTVENVPDHIQSPAAQIRDLWKALGVINDNNYIYPNDNPSTNLSLSLHGGTLYYNGINFTTEPKRPSRKDISSQSLLSFNYRTQTGLGSNGVTVLDPTYYDNAGTITAVPNPGATSTNQRVYLSPTGLVLIQYGQTLYENLDDAIAAVSTESFVVASAIEANAVLIGVISISKDAINLTSTYAKFHNVSKFGELAGSAGSGSSVGSSLAVDIEFTPAGNIEATNVQNAIQELDTEKAPKASPTFTGTVTMPSGVIFGEEPGANTTVYNDNIYVMGNRVWHAGNDGTGSGLDADTLDGMHASEFAISNIQTRIISSQNYSASIVEAINMPEYKIGDMLIVITDIIDPRIDGWNYLETLANNGANVGINYKIASSLDEEIINITNDYSQTVNKILILVLRNANNIKKLKYNYHYSGSLTYPLNDLYSNELLLLIGNARNSLNNFTFDESNAPEGTTFVNSYEYTQYLNMTGVYYSNSLINFNETTQSISDLEMGFGISLVITAGETDPSLIRQNGGFTLNNNSTSNTGFNAVDLSFTNLEGLGATAYRSFAAGMNTRAGGQYSTALGSANFADGSASFAEGESTHAINPYSHTEGRLTATIGGDYYRFLTIDGNTATVDKTPIFKINDNLVLINKEYDQATRTLKVINIVNNIITFNDTLYYWEKGCVDTLPNSLPSVTTNHAEGFRSIASGNVSHAEGQDTVAAGHYSHAQNLDTIADGYAQTVLGKYNLRNGTRTSLIDSDYSLIIGNGTSDSSRSNALTVDWSGNLNMLGNITATSFNGVSSSSLLNYTVNSNTSSLVLNGFTLNSGSSYKLYLNILNSTFNSGDLSLYATYGEPTNYHTQKILSNGTTTTSTRTNNAVIANVSGLSSVVGELNITFDNLSNNFHVDGILRVGQASNIKLYTIAMQGAYTNPQSQLQLSFSGSAEISTGSKIRIIKVF